MRLSGTPTRKFVYRIGRPSSGPLVRMPVPMGMEDFGVRQRNREYVPAGRAGYSFSYWESSSMIGVEIIDT
jgi:hypothetical protein